MCERCCINCFDETEIINFINKTGELGNCDYCDSKDVISAEVESVGEFIRNGIEREFESIENGTGAFYDPEDRCYNTEGFQISEILNIELGIFSAILSNEKQNKLCEDLISLSGPSIGDIQDGDYDWIRSGDLVYRGDLYRSQITREAQMWELFKEVCKHYNRYFDLIDDCYARESLLCQLKYIFEKMETTLPEGTELYRARGWDNNSNPIGFIDFEKETAPAPWKNAKDNRMSPVGISYMYLGDNIATCIRETSSTRLDMEYIVGTFETKQPLKLLDFTKAQAFVPPSCFSENYDYTKKRIKDFIQSFENEISKPLDENNKPIEYIATQVLAEYIRKIGYRGIIYKSSYNSNNKNYVMFCTVKTEMFENCNIYLLTSDGMPPFTDWLKLIRGEVYKVDIKPILISNCNNHL